MELHTTVLALPVAVEPSVRSGNILVRPFTYLLRRWQLRQEPDFVLKDLGISHSQIEACVYGVGSTPTSTDNRRMCHDDPVSARRSRAPGGLIPRRLCVQPSAAAVRVHQGQSKSRLAMSNTVAFAAVAARHRTAGPTSIRSMFRILATDIALSRNDRARLAVARPVMTRRARASTMPARAPGNETGTSRAACYLIALSRARLSWDTGSMFADRIDASTWQLHSSDLVFVISGGARTKLFGTQLAGLVAEGMASLDMPVAVRMTEGSDTNLREDSRWGTPTALRDCD